MAFEGVDKEEKLGLASFVSNSENPKRAQIILICTFVSLTGFFHGYDNGVVSEVFNMPGFREMMGWPAEDNPAVALDKGWTVNGFNIGAAIAAVTSGHLLVDRYGRKPAMILGSFLFAIGGGVQASAMNSLQLILGRLIAGIGVGITSGSGPSYIAEISPASIRGAMVGIYQNFVCLAILVASFLNHYMKTIDNGWRYSLGLQVAMGGITLIGLFFVDESPRFLEQKGRSDEALRVMTRLRGSEVLASAELAKVKVEMEAERFVGEATWTEMFTNPYFRNVVLIGCLVQFFQIMTGINAIVSYGGTIMNDLGISGWFAEIGGSTAFFIGSLIGTFTLVDVAGRRPLLIGGMSIMALSLIVGGIVAKMFLEGDSDAGGFAASWIVICSVMVFMFAFGISWGYGAWLYIPEITPLRVRGKAVGLCTFANWGPANVLSAFATPAMIVSPLGAGGTFLVFGAISVIAVPICVFLMPETRGLSLEEVGARFRFKGRAEFGQFVRGNLKYGNGIVGARNQATSDSELAGSLAR